MLPGWMRAQPLLRVLADIHSAALNASPARFALWVLGKIIVKIEAAIESRRHDFGVENIRADEGRRAVTQRLQQLSQSGMRWRQRHSEIRHAVRARKQSSQNRSVGSIGDGSRGESLRKVYAVFAQAIERRSLNLLIAKAVDVIGTQGVDGDQEDIRQLRLCVRRLPPGC